MLEIYKIFNEIIHKFQLLKSAKPLIILCGGAILISFFELLGVSVVFPMTVLVTQPQILETANSLVAIKKILGITMAHQMIIVLAILIGFSFILKNLANLVFWRYEHKILAKWRVKIAQQIFKLVVHSTYEYYIQKNGSYINYDVSLMPNVIINNFMHAFINLISNLIIVVFLAILVLYINWQIFICVGIIGFLLIFFTQKILRKPFQQQMQAQGENSTRQHNFLLMALGAYKDTKLHQTELKFTKIFTNFNKSYTDSSQKLVFYNQIPTITNELMAIITIVIAIVVALTINPNFQAVFAQLGVFIIVGFRLMPVFNRIIYGLNNINGAIPAIHEFMQRLEKLQQNQMNKLEINNQKPLEFRHELRLQAVNYRYPQSEHDNIMNINLSIKKGEVIGITGSSGGGKTTLSLILQGFITQFNGKFFLDDKLIQADDFGQYRPLVGMVEQKFQILPMSIAQNVAFGKEVAEIDKNQVQQALEKAQIWDFVQNLPNGIWQEVGDNGILLSGGQQQRLAIARAFYRPIEILVLDEASSALDNKTEQDLFRLLHANAANLTIIMVAHRLSTLKNCDKIYFMQNGTISDYGNFQELYAKNPIFAQYCDVANLGLVKE